MAEKEQMDGIERPLAFTRSRPTRTTRAAAMTRHPLPSILLIGASTGGPQALTMLLAGVATAGIGVPICVTLHMPAEFMPVVATHVARTCGIETCVVNQVRELVAGKVYFSPGDRHLDIRRGRGTAELHLRAGDARELCRPAIDAMFTTAARCFGPATLAVVLSGMGKDGLAGARAIVAAGGSVLVQDKGSSAVWGMPGAIAEAELAAAVLPPEALAIEIARRLRRGAHR